MTVINPESPACTLLSLETGEFSMSIESPHPKTIWPSVSILRDRLWELTSHFRGKCLMAYLKMRHRDVMREAEPLAEHLEEQIYPTIKGTQTPWISLGVINSDSEMQISGQSGDVHYVFPGTSQMAASLQRMAISRIDLDARLEAEQISESLLVLIYTYRSLGDESTSVTTDSGWSARSIASAMVHPLGFHKFCALMHFDVADRSYKVEYSYCELFFSKVVRRYIEHSFRKRDHRRLFSAAPRAAFLALLLLVAPMAMIHMSPVLGTVFGLTTALLFAGVLGFTIHTLGSLQYDREHRDLLIQEYLRELRQQEEELKAVNEKLEAMIRVKDDFLRIASHDLKNPLMVIRMAADLLSESSATASLPSIQREKITMIARSTTQMQNIIEDFLDTQALEDGQFILAQERSDCGELLRQAIDLNRDYALGKEIDLILDVQGETPSVMVDPRRVSQVLQNLIGNAIKFCAPGDSVTVGCKPTDESIRVEICDSGPGLTEEDMSHVFTRHSRLSRKPTGTETSSGLGLHICKQLVELHGGRIGVRNNDDRGATFWFELPRVEPHIQRGQNLYGKQ